MTKSSSKRSPYAREILDRKGPYRPKIIKGKKKEYLESLSPADEFDDWYFHDHPSIKRGTNGETSHS